MNEESWEHLEEAIELLNKLARSPKTMHELPLKVENAIYDALSHLQEIISIEENE